MDKSMFGFLLVGMKMTGSKMKYNWKKRTSIVLVHKWKLRQRGISLQKLCSGIKTALRPYQAK